MKEAVAAWLARAPAAHEVIFGLHSSVVARGRLDDGDMQPGQKPRAGGYNEDRTGYTSSLFAPGGEEPRTVHIGLDVFAPAGTEVFAPLAGHIHSFADNARFEDYGPTIILTHEPEPGVIFHTLYGHLSRESLEGLAEGAPVDAGQRIATLGDRTVNGGWPPHLHFQITLDMLGLKGDFPGVCRRSERERWLALCPDPAPLLGLRTMT
jgi:murein DD-endopeptidase MepM/ murein hydrolase activator NlpD